MVWRIIVTDRFSRDFNKLKRDMKFVRALHSKIERLREDPFAVGKELSGKLAGKRSTRLVKNYRVLFEIDSGAGKVYLLGFDHRKFEYKGFS